LNANLALHKSAYTTLGIPHHFNILDLFVFREMVRKQTGELLLIDIGRKARRNFQASGRRFVPNKKLPAHENAGIVGYFIFPPPVRYFGTMVRHCGRNQLIANSSLIRQRRCGRRGRKRIKARSPSAHFV
jgi:hypothetical protein